MTFDNQLDKIIDIPLHYIKIMKPFCHMICQSSMINQITIKGYRIAVLIANSEECR